MQTYGKGATKLILADEPTGSLSTEQGMQIIQMLVHEAKAKQRCIVVVSHDQRIASFSDRIFYMQDGNVSLQSG